MISKLDVFPKIKTQQGTIIGGLLTTIVVFLMALYTYSQTIRFLNPSKQLILGQSKGSAQPYQVRLDIIFHKLPCHILSMDLQDQLLGHFVDIGSLVKNRLDYNGQVIQAGYNQKLDYGKNLQQITNNALKNRQGCRMYGMFTMRQVPGNFHFSHHAFINRVNVNYFYKTQLDFSATIIHLIIGDQNYVQNLQQQLKRPISIKNQYFQCNNQIREIQLNLVKVVSSNYFKKTTNSYMIQYNTHSRSRVGIQEGIFFLINVGQYEMTLRQIKVPLNEYLTWLFGVLSGMFYIGMLLDRFIHYIFLLSVNEYK